MPPIIKRQNPNVSPNGPLPRPGSLLSQVIPVEDLEATYLRFLIYGGNRVGKTYLACTFPKPLLVVSFEPNQDSGGATSVKKFKGVSYLHLSSTEQAAQLCIELSENNPYKSVVFDSVTSYQDLVLKEIMGVTELPAQLNFGAVTGDQYRYRAERTKDGLRAYTKLKCHTIFTAKEKDHNPPKEERVNEKTGKTQPDMRPRFLRGMQHESCIAADIGGATVGWMQDVCDYITRLYFDKEMVRREFKMGESTMAQVEETGRFVRCLRIAYHPNFAAGFRSEHGDGIPDVIENPTYEKIEKVIRGGSLT